jgi:hypothetical protein
MAWDIDRAREFGIDVEQVFSSWATHLSAERSKVRENPKLLDADKLPERYSLAVEQRNVGTGVQWRNLGALPHGMPDITVEASSFDAARQRMSVRALLEQRFLVQFAYGLLAQGLYPEGLEGRREALRAAMASQVFVADIALGST